MTPTPLLGRHIKSVPRDPDLIGVLSSGDLVDLDGGTIQLHPNQILSHSSDSRAKPRVQDGRHEYTLTFAKTVGWDDEWIRWWVANDEPFTVAGIRFRLDASDTDGLTVTYRAGGVK